MNDELAKVVEKLTDLIEQAEARMEKLEEAVEETQVEFEYIRNRMFF